MMETAMNEAQHRDLLNTVGKFAVPLITAPGAGPKDYVMIASAFVTVAEEIFKAVGGAALAAQQFYAAADRLVGESTT